MCLCKYTCVVARVRALLGGEFLCLVYYWVGGAIVLVTLWCPGNYCVGALLCCGCLCRGAIMSGSYFVKVILCLVAIYVHSILIFAALAATASPDARIQIYCPLTTPADAAPSHIPRLQPPLLLLTTGTAPPLLASILACHSPTSWSTSPWTTTLSLLRRHRLFSTYTRFFSQ